MSTTADLPAPPDSATNARHGAGPAERPAHDRTAEVGETSAAAAALLRRDPGRPVPGRRGADRPGCSPFTPQLDASLYGDELHVAEPGRHRRGRWPSRSRPPAPRTRTAPSPRCIPAGRRRRDHPGRVHRARARREAAHRLRRPVHRAGPRAADHLVRLDPADDLARRPAPQPAPGRVGRLLLRARRELAVGHRARRADPLVAPASAAEPHRADACSCRTWPPAKGVRRTRGWHAATGVWLAVGLLFLSATGLTWSRYAGANFGAALDALNAHAPRAGHRPRRRHRRRRTGGRPPRRRAGAAGAVDPAAHRHASLATARDGRASTGPVEITVPAERRRRLDRHADRQHLAGRATTRVAVDPATDTVTAPSRLRRLAARWPS